MNSRATLSAGREGRWRWWSIGRGATSRANSRSGPPTGRSACSAASMRPALGCGRCRSSIELARRVILEEGAHAPDRLVEEGGTLPVLLDLDVGRQCRDLLAGLGRMRLVGAGLQVERRPAGLDEVAGDREHEVAA